MGCYDGRSKEATKFAEWFFENRAARISEISIIMSRDLWSLFCSIPVKRAVDGQRILCSGNGSGGAHTSA